MSTYGQRRTRRAARGAATELPGLTSSLTAGSEDPSHVRRERRERRRGAERNTQGVGEEAGEGHQDGDGDRRAVFGLRSRPGHWADDRDRSVAAVRHGVLLAGRG